MNTSFQLNTGDSIPAIGLGTWRSQPGQVRDAVVYALQNGYKHLDCALCYQNEDEIGQGIKDSGVKREDIFITSKLWCTYHDRVEQCLDITLKSLGTSYLDLYLVHWPARTVENGTSELFPVTESGARNVDWDWDQAETWRQMEALLTTGKVKAIGVSNYSEILLAQLEKSWTVVPAVNQVELHPYNPQHSLKAYCKKREILLQAYSPLGSADSPLGNDDVVVEMAARYTVAVTTILLSWSISRGVVALPKSTTPSRIQANLITVDLESNDMLLLDGLAATGKQLRVNTPNWMTDFGFSDWYGPGNRAAPKGARLLATKSRSLSVV